MSEPPPGSALAEVRSHLERMSGRAPGLPSPLPGGEMLTVVLGDGEHTLALAVAANGYGAACSCGQWDALQHGSSRWILARIAESWRQHLHRSEASGG